MHKDCFFTAASILMGLVLTQSRTATASESSFGLSQSSGEQMGGHMNGTGLGKVVLE